jgi:hypothetical protein
VERSHEESEAHRRIMTDARLRQHREEPLGLESKPA